MMIRTLFVAVLLPAALAGAVWRYQAAAETASQETAAPVAAIVQKLPRAVAVDNVYDFGIMNPGDKRHHEFIVRNEGDAELTLELGSTTCKCTLAKLTHVRIPPGGSTEIELDWHTEQPQFRFRQAAVINTNDPRMPQFELAVEGSVRVKLASAPGSAYFADAPRDEARWQQVLLYSQAYDRIEFGKLESTLPTVAAELEPELPTEEADNILVEHGRYVRRLNIVKRPEGKAGSFEGIVRIPYVGTWRGGGRESGVYELPVHGETVGDVTLHGRHVVGKMLQFGQIRRAQTKTATVYIHFRGGVEGLQLRVEEVKPEFLRVSVGEAQKLSASMTRVPVEVVVPSGSPTVNHSTHDLGEIRLNSTHPDYKYIQFPVSVVVEP